MKTTSKTALLKGLFARLIACITLIIVVGITAAFTNTAQAESDYRVYIKAYLGPDPLTHPTEAFNVATNLIWQEYNNPTIPDQLGHRITPENILQPVDRSNTNQLCFLLHIVSQSVNVTMSPVNLAFIQKSSDFNNTLGKTNYFSAATTNYICGPNAMGVTWESIGRPRFSDVRTTAGSFSQSTNNHEFFLVVEAKCYVYTNAAHFTALKNFLLSLQDFQVTGTFKLLDNAVDVAHAHKTMHMNLNPGPGVLAIKAAPPVQVEIGLNADNVDSYVLEYRSVLIDAPWSDQATITGNETVFRPSGTLMEGYWRARLQ